MSSTTGSISGENQRSELKRHAQPKENALYTEWGSKVIETPKRMRSDERFTHTELCPRCEIINNLTVPHATNCKVATPIAYWICRVCAPKLDPMARISSRGRSDRTSNAQQVFQNNEEAGTPLDITTAKSVVGNDEGDFFVDQIQKELESEMLSPQAGEEPHAEV